MKVRALVLLSAVIYFGLALLFLGSLFWWPDYTGRVMDSAVAGVILLLATVSAFLGFAVIKSRNGSRRWFTAFAVIGGPFTGLFAGFTGWKGGLVFLVPLCLALFSLWRRHSMLANSTVDGDARKSGARASP